MNREEYEKMMQMTNISNDNIKEMMMCEAIKKIKYPFRNLTMEDVMKDLKISRATVISIFNRKDFPSVNIGKTKAVTLLAYLYWKMERREKE